MVFVNLKKQQNSNPKKGKSNTPSFSPNLGVRTFDNYNQIYLDQREFSLFENKMVEEDQIRRNLCGTYDSQPIFFYDPSLWLTSLLSQAGSNLFCFILGFFLKKTEAYTERWKTAIDDRHTHTYTHTYTDR